MKCKECSTEYMVQVGVKGQGCPNKRNHEKHVRLRIRKLIKEKGIGYVTKQVEKIPFHNPKRDWGDEELEKAVKKKSLDKDRMNGVYIICSYLPTEENERYDILADSDYNYSLVLNQIDENKEIKKIDYCDGDEFCKKLLEYRDKVMPDESDS